MRTPTSFIGKWRFRNWMGSFFSSQNAAARRGKPRVTSPVIRLEGLEDRCLLAAPVLVANPLTTRLDQVFSTTATDGLPAKYVTILNNSNDPVYPILFDANSTKDLTVSTKLKARIDNAATQITVKS